MSQVYLPNDAAGVLLRVQLPGFEPSWAGPNPCAEGFCLGAEDGRLLFTNEDLVTTGSIGGAALSKEAVNGVGHSQNWTVVTTRADINLIGPRPSPGAPHESSSIERGAFGVAVAPSGYFVLPLGRPGIMYLKPGCREDDPVRISNTEHAGLNLYRVLPLPGEEGEDIIVCAGRRGGLGLTSFREDLDRHGLSVVQLDDLDVVDVCAPRSGENQRAIAAAAKDGTIIFPGHLARQDSPDDSVTLGEWNAVPHL